MIDRLGFLASAGAFVAQAAAPPAPPQLPAPAGTTIYVPLASAPFPHPSRPAYTDATVGIYVPPHFRTNDAVDYIVHFHGWHNHVSEVLRRYELREQLDAAGFNAVLVVPQGPKDAADSGGGKLELDTGGFARFIGEVAKTLQSRALAPQTRIGRIVLSSHSGGYGTVGGILTRGGMNASIPDVLLFDSAYGYFDAIANWTKSAPDNHLLSFYTPGGGTVMGNTEIMARLQGARGYQVLDAAAMTPAKLATRDATFIYTLTVEHDMILQQNRWFELALGTTALAAVRS
jgi:hypothetical protein